jgi:hypothetical protein
MKYSLDLITNNEVLVEFTRANSELLSKHTVSSTEELISLWQSVYNVELDLPHRLNFKSEKDLTMFLLRWS